MLHKGSTYGHTYHTTFSSLNHILRFSSVSHGIEMINLVTVSYDLFQCMVVR